MGEPLTLRDELVAMRARLKALHREHGEHTRWLGIAANEVSDALKELPRAVLAQRLPDAPSALEERRGPARADGGGAAVEPAVSVPRPESMPTGPKYPELVAPARHACSVCGQHGHNARRHKREAPAAPPAEAPASDDEEPEPALGSAAAIVAHRDNVEAWLPAPAKEARSRDILPVLLALRPWADRLSPGQRRVYDMRIEGHGPTEIAARLDSFSAVVSTTLFQARRRLETLRDADQPPVLAALPVGPHAVRHFLAAPDAGEGLARCGALGESVRVVAKLSMVTCPECARLMGARCRRCDKLGHVMRDCPLKGDQGVATLRAYRAEQAAKLDAVLEAPVELVTTQPAPPSAEDLPTPSPGRGELLDDQRGGAGDDLAAPPPSACSVFGASNEEAKEEGCGAPPTELKKTGPDPHSAKVASLAGWDRDDPDEDFAEFDDGANEEATPPAPPAQVAAPLPEHIAKLQPAHRAAYEAIVLGGRSYDDVARERGVTRQTAVVMLGKAKMRLRQLAAAPTLITPPPALTLVASSGSDPTAAQARVRAKLRVVNGRVRAKTIPIGTRAALRRDERAMLEDGDLLDPSAYDRPRTRGDCETRGENEARPCPWVSCPHHLALDVNAESGALKLNFPHLEVWEMAETCSLDVADRGGITLEEVGAILNLTRERIRQVEVRGLAKIKDNTGDELGLMPDRADRDVG